MYTQFFGFNKLPFKITPDPAFFFAGSNRGAVLEALLYAVARGEGIVKVVGEVGSGKTMICRMLERELPQDCEIVYLANPRLSPNEILYAIAMELQLKVARRATKVEVMRLLHACLVEKHAQNRKVVMFIEEAQGMSLDTLEEVRLLSNLETTQDKLLQIVLFGQPELDDKLCAHEIRQLKERITYAFDLTALNRQEIRDYLNLRIRESGFRGSDLFTPAAIRTLHRSSQGLLRRINILADKALLAAFSRGERLIEPRHMRMAAKDSEFDTPSRYPTAIIAAAAVIIMALGAGAWWMNLMTPLIGVDGSDRNAAVGAERLPAATESVHVTGKSSDNAVNYRALDEFSVAFTADDERSVGRHAATEGIASTLLDPLLAARLMSLKDLEFAKVPDVAIGGLNELLE